ncbi:MAG: phospholipid-binding protein MlaC [Rhizomicrobium sp.]|jgi:phospholipid transport system substrate-binding protein
MRYGWRLSIFVVVVLSVGAPLPAGAQAPVEAFLQQSIDRGIAVLKDKSLDNVGRREKISDMLVELLDTRKMALFMLGNLRETAAASDLDVYAEAYKAYTIASYESQLGSYGGQSLKVTGSVERAPGDYIVDAVVVDPALSDDPTLLPVAFRVVDERDGKFAVVDASIAGIWLGLAQRAEFGAYLNQHGRSVAALTAHLQETAARLADPAN